MLRLNQPRGYGITGKSKTKHPRVPRVPRGLIFLNTQVKNALDAENVRIRESPIPNADGHLLTSRQPSHTTRLFSVHSFAKRIGTAIGYQPGNRTCVSDR